MEWRYCREDDVYYCLGIPYAENHPDGRYGTLGVFVPGAYLRGERKAGYTAQTAPIVLPVHTPGYASMPSLTGYDPEARPFTDAGFVYVRTGCRGREHGAPWAVTDLKAAVRFLRGAQWMLGCRERVFTFGMSGGGAQSALLGAAGDSPAYAPYLAQLGAAAGSDAVLGSMCWCPVTTLDMADAAYEWNMGAARPERSRLSEELAGAYPDYVRALGLCDGTDCEAAVCALLTRSLNHFLADTAFPWREWASAGAYVAALNAGEKWIDFDGKTARVTDMAAFARACKRPWKPVGAFDNAQKPTVENELFGGHFSRAMAAVHGTDMTRPDALGVTVEDRVAMMDPLHFLCECFPQYRTAKIAPYWRIRTGAEQGDTALTTELNLARALEAYGADVDFETVWAQGHVLAERRGTPEENFIAWVNECMDKEDASCGC